MDNVIPFGIHAPFFNEDTDEEFEEDAPSRYRDEIIAQFERSAEGVALAATSGIRNDRTRQCPGAYWLR